ncbi:hypothetical protein O3M35_006499 [Rhynocoris fuscipes]|uniref:RRM domain-containing protein n=1 Tax=Rhynocoris fuscipes TaxID=488301 RepID=A0AAW1DJJ7_9HEMI
MYDIFGKYGAIRQIRIGTTLQTKGTAFVVYEDILDAMNAVEKLNGFNVCNRYLVLLYYQQNRVQITPYKTDKERQEEQKDIKSRYGI